VHNTFKRGSIARSDYEPAIPCIRWLSENNNPAVSAQAREILAKAESKIPSTKTGCFVATASYGPWHGDVIVLQDYRDRIIMRFFLGRCFVRMYYFLSPPLARFIGASNRRRSLARELLRPFVACARRRLKQSQCPKPSTNDQRSGAN
jgi:hypothetical protein